jgi:hypothetical protein
VESQDSLANIPVLREAFLPVAKRSLESSSKNKIFYCFSRSKGNKSEDSTLGRRWRQPAGASGTLKARLRTNLLDSCNNEHLCPSYSGG